MGKHGKSPFGQGVTTMSPGSVVKWLGLEPTWREGPSDGAGHGPCCWRTRKDEEYKFLGDVGASGFLWNLKWGTFIGGGLGQEGQEVSRCMERVLAMFWRTWKGLDEEDDST